MKNRVKLMGGVTVPRTLSMALRLSLDGFYTTPEPRRETSDGNADQLFSEQPSSLYEQKLRTERLRNDRWDHTFNGKHEWRRYYITRWKEDSHKMHRNLKRIDRKLELMLKQEDNEVYTKPIHTNETLHSYGFISERERNQFFLAYGKDAVRQGLDLFYIFNVQPNKEMVVATIDMVAREGYANTGRIFHNGGDIVADVKKHYGQSTSVKPIGTEVSRDSLTYLIRTYIFGEDMKLPEPVVVEIEPTSKKISPYVTEFRRYSAEDVKNFRLALAKDGLTLDDVMEEGVIVSDVGGYHLVFNEVLALLAGGGLKPNEFQAIEKTHELDRRRSKNSGIEYVRLKPVESTIGMQYERADLMNILYGKHRDNPFKASDKFEQ